MSGFFVVIRVTDGCLRVERLPADEHNTLEGMQALVGGDIESFGADWPSGSRRWITVSAVCHGEGRLIGLPMTCMVVTGRGVFDICGPLLITGLDEEGNTVGLTEEEIAELAVAPGPTAEELAAIGFSDEILGLSWVLHRSMVAE